MNEEKYNLIPYFFIFFVLAFFSILDVCRDFRRVNIIFFILCVVILILFSGFRSVDATSDTLNYINRFLYTPDAIHWFNGDYTYKYFDTYMEPGYLFFGAIIRVFTDSYVFLLTSVSVFSIGIAAFYYYRYSYFPFVTLVLFFVHTYLYRDMTQIRSAIAAAIALFLIGQIHKNQHLKIIFTIFFASLFHSAALSYFVVYFLSFIEYTRLRLIIGYFFALAFGLLHLSSHIIYNLPSISFLTAKINDYQAAAYIDSVKLFDLTNIKNSVVLFVLFFFWDKIKSKVLYFETMMLFYFLATTWRIAFSDIGIFAARISTFFGIVEVLLITSLIYILRQKVIGVLIVLLYAFLTLYLNLFYKNDFSSYSMSFSIM